MSEREIFLAAIDIPNDSRAAFLDEKCSGDPTRRIRVEALLRSHDEAGHSVGNPLITSESGDATRTFIPNPGMATLLPVPNSLRTRTALSRLFDRETF